MSTPSNTAVTVLFVNRASKITSEQVSDLIANYHISPPSSSASSSLSDSSSPSSSSSAQIPIHGSESVTLTFTQKSEDKANCRSGLKRGDANVRRLQCTNSNISHTGMFQQIRPIPFAKLEEMFHSASSPPVGGDEIWMVTKNRRSSSEWSDIQISEVPSSDDETPVSATEGWMNSIANFRNHATRMIARSNILATTIISQLPPVIEDDSESAKSDTDNPSFQAVWLESEPSQNPILTVISIDDCDCTNPKMRLFVRMRMNESYIRSINTRLSFNYALTGVEMARGRTARWVGRSAGVALIQEPEQFCSLSE